MEALIRSTPGIETAYTMLRVAQRYADRDLSIVYKSGSSRMVALMSTGRAELQCGTARTSARHA